jgi:hypothetical protein
VENILTCIGSGTDTFPGDLSSHDVRGTEFSMIPKGKYEDQKNKLPHADIHLLQ